MRKLYAFTHSVKNLAGLVVSVLKKGMPPSLNQDEQNSFTPSIYQLTPEYIQPKFSQMQMFTNTAKDLNLGRRIKVMLTVFFAVLISTGFAQVASYSYAVSSGTYTAITGGTVSHAAGWDDTQVNTVPIGFSFTFNGISYTTVSINPNGYLEFNGAVTAAYTPISGTTVYDGAVAAWGRDLQAQAATPTGEISYLSSGGVFTVQWSNTRRYFSTTANAERIEFQIQLVQATNQIRFVYGNWSNAISATSTENGEVGLRGASNADFKNLTVASGGSWASPAAGAVNSAKVFYNQTSVATKPASGLTYTFTPPPPCVVPANQASGLTFGATTFTTIPGSFTAAPSAPTGYLVVRYPAGATVTNPVNTTAYAPGTALGLGTVVSNGGTTSFTASGLSANTTYDFYIYSFNNALCTGGPLYNTTSPLTGSAATPAGTLSGIKTVGGSTTDYPNLTTAFAAINASGLAGNVELQLVAGYPFTAETFPIATSSTTSTLGFSIKVYPTASGITITGNAATGLINLNGSSNITFDGRVNQAGVKNLEVSNTSSTGYVFQFVNDASSNIIQHCTIRGVSNTATNAVILFGGTTGVTGNDNNTIDNCDIRDGGGTPVNGIYSVGNTVSVPAYNSGNTVSNCNIYNFFIATLTTSGIYLAGGNTGWTITGNSIYQTSSRTYTSALTHYGIRIDNTTNGNGFTVANNFIGGTAPNAGGTPYTILGTIANLYRGIYIGTAVATASSVQGNTVANFAFTTSSGSTTLPGVFSGIHVAAGLVNVGTVAGNTIGAATGNGSITVTSTATGGIITGIHGTSGAALTIQNNNIGSFSTNSAAAIGHVFQGISVGGSGSHTISANNIGSASSANSISIGTAGTTTATCDINGIISASSGTPLVMSSNNVYNGTTFTTGASTIHGLYSNTTVTTLTMSSNIVRDLRASSASGTIYGLRASTTQYTMASNQVYNLSFNANSGTSASIIYGIFDGASPTAETLTGNLINNLSIAGANTSAGNLIAGIHTNTAAGTKTWSGNIINAFSFTNSATGTATLHGIFTALSTPNIFKNKIYDLSAAGATSLVNGITISSGTNVNVYNNLIGDLKAPAGNNTNFDVIRGINILSTTATSNNNISFNSIYLNASGGAAFTTSGIYHTFNTTATTSTLVLRNNIIVNLSTPGTGFTIGIRRSAATDLNNYSTTSNNNNIYAGTSSANNLIYYDGTNSDLTLSAFKTRMGATRELVSISENPTFISTSGANVDFLHLNPSAGTQLESGGITVGGITDDYDGNTRNLTTPDIGADEFNGTSPAPANSNLSIPVNTCITGTATAVSVDVSTPGGVITGVTITYNNGTITGPVAMTGPDGNASGTWTFTIPAGTPGATVTWSVTSTNSLSLSTTTNGASYKYLPLTGYTVQAVANNPTICAGSTAILTTSITTPPINVTLGAGATTASSYDGIFYYLFGGVKSQFLVKASELTALGLSAGNISALQINMNAAGGPFGTSDGFTISVAPVGSLANMSSSSLVSAGMVQVFYNPAGYSPTAGINNFAFGTGAGSSSSFSWNGTDNIVVQFCWSNNNGGGTSAFAKVDAPGFTSCAYYRSDSQTGSALCSNNSVTGNNTNRPQFTFTGIGTASITANSWSDGSSVVGTTNPVTITGVSTLTYTNNLTALGCTLSSLTLPQAPTVTVTVNPLPSVPTDATTATQCGIPTFAVTTGVATPTINWYTVPTGGSPISSGASLSYAYTGFTGGGATNTLYASVTDGNSCESPRLQINVVVNDPVALTISQTGTQNICVNEIETLSVTSPLGNYSSYVWSPSTNLYTDAGATIPYDGIASATTVYYKRSSAAASELITLTGSGTCTATAGVTFAVNIYPVITAITATPDTLCSGNTVVLQGFSASAPGTLFAQPFETYPVASFVTSGTGITWAGSNTYFVQGAGAVENTYTASANGSLEMASDISLVGIGSPTLQFSHIVASEAGLDLGIIEYSTNSGSSWTAFPASAYAGTGTLFNTSVTFDKNSYSDWSSLFTTSGVPYPAAPATSLWKTETVNLSAYTSASTFRVRFRFVSDVSVQYPGWKIDDVKIGYGSVNQASNYTWSWTTTLGAPAITDGATTSHVPVNPGPSVVTGTYTATATLNGCTGTPFVSDIVVVNPPAVAPVTQATSIVLSPVTTAVTINFTAAAGNPDGYLVVRAASQPTDPVNTTVYTAGTTALGGTIVGAGLPPFTDNGLTSNTAYTYWVYAYNGTTACAGPIYNVSSPATASITTCGDAPVSAAASDTTGTGFTAHWAVSVGATGYLLDVSTASNFSSFVPGYNSLPVAGGSTTSAVITGLTNQTAYYYRVRATNGGCISSNSSVISVTTYSSVPWVENFGTGTAIPAGWVTTSNQFVETLIGTANSSIITNLYVDVATDSFRVPIFAPFPAGQFLSYQYVVMDYNDDLQPVTFTAAGWGSFQLQASTNYGATWTNIDTLVTAPTPTGYVTHLVDVSAFAGTNATFRVVATWTTGDYYLSFDNFNINPACSTPTTQPTALTFPTVGSASLSGSFTAAAAPGATAYLVLRTPQGVSPDTAPVDVATYNAGAALGNATVIYSGAATSFSSAGLTANTTYRYTIYSYNDGCAGGPKYNTVTPLFGEQSTAASLTITSVTSGSWKNPATWSSGIVPAIYDLVTIAATHTVIVDTTAFDSTLTIIGTLEFDTTPARTLTSASHVTIQSAGIFRTAATGTQTGHQLITRGNVIVNGTLDFSTNSNTAGAGITFSGTNNNTFSTNSGTTVDIRTLTINKGTTATGSTLEVTGEGFTVRGTSAPANAADSVAHGFLTLTNGQLKLSNTVRPTLTRLFATAAYTIPATAGLWLNSPVLTVYGQAGTATNNGSFRLSTGTYNVGTAVNNAFLGGADSAVFNIESGILNVAGRFNSTNAIKYSQSGGVVTVTRVGNSNANASFGFTSTAAGTQFNMSAGTIIIQNASTNATPIDYRVVGTTASIASITGGILQFGNSATPAGTSFTISNGASATGIVAPSIILDNTTNTKNLRMGSSGTGPLYISGSLTINAGDTLSHTNTATAGQSIYLFGNSGVPGNIINNGLINLSTGSINNSIRFEGTGFGAASLSGSGNLGTATAAYGTLVFNNGLGVTLSQTDNVVVSRINLQGNGGVVTNSAKITLGTAGASAATIQLGGQSYATATGVLDAAPVFNVGTGGLTIRYDSASNAVTTGVEIPVSRVIKSLVIDNTNNVTLAGGDLSDTTLTLTNGQLITDASNKVIVLGTTPSSITRTNGWVNGPVQRSFAAATTGAGTYILPVGKSSYAGFELLNPVTTNAGLIESEFFEGATGGSPGIQMNNLNEQGYWLVTDLGGTTFDTARIRVTSPVTINAGTDALARSNDETLTGVYDYLGASSPNVPVNTISSDPTPLVTGLGYFTLGTKGIPMVFDSAITFQTAGTSNIFTGSTNQLLIGVRVRTTNNNPAMTLNSMTFTLGGSNLPNLDNNISAITLYTTGNTNTFAATQQVGAQVIAPFAVPPSTFTISDAITLLPGDNYFWLTVDVAPGATVLDTLDATCTSVNVTDNNTANTFDSIPKVIAPAGNRVIKNILNGEYSIGAGSSISGEAGHFQTITSALAALNDVGVSGPVSFILTDSAYKASTGETFPLTINAYANASDVNTLTIKPNVTGINIYGTSASAIFVLNAADYVTIDGSVSATVNTVCPPSSASRDLTIINTSTSSSSAVVWLQATATDSATNNTVKNCILTGNSNTSTLIGVGAGSSTISLTTLPLRANNNNSYINNDIRRAQNGIVTNGVSIGRKITGTVISLNLINSATPNNISKGGILIGFQNGPVITGNRIAGMTVADSYGISLGNSGISATTLTGSEVTNATVSNNVINNIVTTTASSAVGILVMSAATGTNTISNNMVSGIQSRGTSGDIAAGIFIGGGAGITNIYHNTVSLTGDRGATSTFLYPSYALAIGGNNPVVNVINNILHNTQTSNSTSTNFRSYAIAVGYTTFTNLTSNYNNLFVSGANGVFGLRGTLVPTTGTAVASLAAWQTNPGKDLNSKNVAPAFISATDMHLSALDITTTTNLVGTGTTLSVTEDIDCETRATLPTIGADELLPCNGAIGGTATPPATSSFCGASSAGTTITATGYSTPLNGTYQWQSSTDNFATAPVNITGAIDPASYTIATPITATTYYRLKVTCTSGVAEAFSNIVTITIVGAPLADVDTTGGAVFCSPTPGAITLSVTTDFATPAPAYQWQFNGADIVGETSATFNVPTSQAGSYTVKVTNASTACVTTSAATVITNGTRPSVPVVSPATPAICAGGNQVLTTSSIASPSGTFGTLANKNTNTTYPAPYSVYYGGQRMQILVLASELTARGFAAGSTINSVGFPVDSLGSNWDGSTTTACQNFKVKAGFTTLPALTTFVAGLPTYFGPEDFTPVVGSGASNLLSFASGPVWDGTSNLIIETTFSNAITGGTNDAVIQYYTPTTFNSMIQYRVDGTAAATVEAATTISNGPNANRPDFVLNGTQTVTSFTWSPGATLSSTTGSSVTATPAVTTPYTVIATAPNGCTRTGGVTVTVNPLPTVSADSAAYKVGLTVPQTTTLPYTATLAPTTYSVVWDAPAITAGFVNVTDAAIVASPLTINVPAFVASATYTGTISVKNANTCVSTGDAFTLIIVNGAPVWTGNTSTDWNTGSNWLSGTVPASGADVTINRTGAFNPVLTGNTTVGSLNINANNTVSLNGFTLTANSGIASNTGTLIGSDASNLVLGATSSVRMSASAGQNVLKDLSVNAGTTTLVSPLSITGGTGAANNLSNGVVTVANGAVIASGGNLTFKSNASGTARLAIGSIAGGYVTGDVTVERYIPQNTYRAWRFLSVPTGGTQKIRQAWQENPVSEFNPNPGYGTTITSNLSNWSALGFDGLTTSPSMQRWNSAGGTTGAWVNITATTGSGTTGNIATRGGYTVFIRGDRATPIIGSSTTASSTTLRTTGPLYTGDQPNTAIGSGRFDLIGNTYVSPIDFLALNRVNMANSFYLWDPKLVTGTPPNQQLGAYVTFSAVNSWVGVPNNSSYGTTPNTTIQSGEAFLIKANTGGGSIGLREVAKIEGNGVNMFRPATAFEKLKANVYTVAPNTSDVMVDGNVSVFDDLFSNAVDGDDALKLTNSGENFAIRREARNLVVEGRQAIIDYDTTYFWMWNIRQGQQYKLELITENMNVPGRSAFLVDAFANTTTQLDLSAGVTNYIFSISSTPASSASDRFKVVYRQVELAPVPVSFVSVNAQLSGAAVKVDWKVAGEAGIRQYVVERSADGRNFAGIGNVSATNNRSAEVSYSWLDATPLTGSNFYRIKSVGVAGDVKYTYIVKVLTNNVLPSFTIAPNPVEGSVVNVQFKNQLEGRYTFRLLATTGETVFTAIREHAGGNGTQLITLPATIARGTYQLEILSPDKKKEVQNLFINTLK